MHIPHKKFNLWLINILLSLILRKTLFGQQMYFTTHVRKKILVPSSFFFFWLFRASPSNGSELFTLFPSIVNNDYMSRSSSNIIWLVLVSRLSSTKYFIGQKTIPIVLLIPSLPLIPLLLVCRSRRKDLYPLPCPQKLCLDNELCVHNIIARHHQNSTASKLQI